MKNLVLTWKLQNRVSDDGPSHGTESSPLIHSLVREVIPISQDLEHGLQLFHGK